MMEKLDAWRLLADFYSGVRKEMDLTLKVADLRLIEFRILNYLRLHGPSTLAGIANELTVMQSGIPFLIEGIESRGLVKRKSVESGKRVIFISLTPLGGRRLNAALKLQMQLAQERMGRLSTAELSELRLLLNRLVGNG